MVKGQSPIPDQGERDDLVMELVFAALARTPGTRVSYLRSVCGHDSALYAEVQERVLWEERMEGFLTQSVIETLKLLDSMFESGRTPNGKRRRDHALVHADRFQLNQAFSGILEPERKRPSDRRESGDLPTPHCECSRTCLDRPAAPIQPS